MGSRGQSNVIGAVLLLGIITLTVTASGGVVLTEWESDLGGDPVAEIDSDLTLNSVELEHFGGDEINVSETVVLLDGNSIRIPLTEFDGVDERFVGGMTARADEFKPIAGDVSLRVVHKPSQTVVHSDSYALRFLLLVAGESGPVFMFEEPPVNYTVSAGTELSVADETVIDLNEDAQNITGLQTGENTTITAVDGDETQTVDITVLDPEPLDITTVDVNATGPDLIELTSELTDLGELDETGLYVRYRHQQPVTFNGDPTDNGDDVIGHGNYYSDPAGYAHDGRWVHDNTPLVPGTNRTYDYITESQIYSIVGTLRDEPETEETYDADEFAIPEIDEDGWDFLTRNDRVPTNRRFNITVSYADDGEAVRVYVDGHLNQTWTDGIASYDELYFSAREGGGPSDDEEGLRLLSSPALSAPQYELIDPGVDSPTTDISEFGSATPDTLYVVEAYTEREISNGVANATGRSLAVRTEKLVETREPTEITAQSVQLEGELTESLGTTDLSFVVVDSNGTVVTDTTVATGLDSPQRFNTTIEGLAQNRSYTYYARADDTAESGTAVSDTGKRVGFTTDEPAIETVDANATGADTLSVEGYLTDIGGLNEIDLYVRYAVQQPVTFNGKPDDNGDDVIAHGNYYTDPAGYAHDGRWVHDNTPLVPGTNRTYDYITAYQSYSIVGTLRDEPELDETYDAEEFAINEIEDWDFLTRNERVPTNRRFNITVSYADDGEAVRVYVDGQLNRTWTNGIASYDELYFSTREGGGPSDDEEGLRLLSSPTLGVWQSNYSATATAAPNSYTGPVSGIQPDTVYFVESSAERRINGRTINATGKTIAIRTGGLVETREPTAVGAEDAQLEGELVDSLGETNVSFVLTDPNGTVLKSTTVGTGLDSSQQFNTTVDGLEPNRSYRYYARAEESGGAAAQITDTGEGVAFTTDEPNVETVDTRATDADTLAVDGNLTNIAGLSEMDLYVRYAVQQPVTFNGKPDDNGDDVIAHGSYYTNPAGYAHDGRWVHDNTPLVPGTNRTYDYITESQIYSIVGTLRDEPETEETYDANEFAIPEIDDWDFLTRNKRVPTDRRFNITVSYADDGEAVRVYVDGQLNRTWTNGIASYDELYFSTREGGGPSDDEEGLRLLSSPTLGVWQSNYSTTATAAPSPYTGPVSGLQPDTVYFVEAYATRTVDGQLINATGETVATRTERLVTTRAETDVSAEDAQLEGELLNSLGETNVSFVLTDPNGTVLRNTTVATGLDSPQRFNTTVERLDPNRSYVYYARAEESGGADRITGAGPKIRFRTKEPEVATVDAMATGADSFEFDGELTSIAGLSRMDLYVRYAAQQPVTFNGKPDDNGDDVIAHGSYYTDPAGYAHDGRWVHDNTPLVAGASRTYEYRTESQIYSIVGTLRDEPELDETYDAEEFAIEEIGDWDFLTRNERVPTNRRFNITVEYADDGEAVRVYVDGQLNRTWTNEIASYDELYFSTREGGGPSDDEEGLRLLSSPTLGGWQADHSATATFGPYPYTDTVSGLQPDTVYFVEAHANRTVNGQLINATGETVAVRTDEP